MRIQDINRLILALSPNKIALGAVMEDIIDNEIIPQVKKLVNSADDEEDKSRLADLADELKKSTSSSGKMWNVLAAGQVEKAIPVPHDDYLAQQMAQDIALKFYSSQRVREFYKEWLENVVRGIERGKKEGTIDGLKKLWSTVITLQTKEVFRKYMNTRYKGVPHDERGKEQSLDHESEEGRSVYESIPSREQGTPRLDDEFILDALNTTYRTFTRKWKPDDGRSIYFNLWMDNISKGKPIERKILQDDFAEAYEKQTGKSMRRDDGKWKSNMTIWSKEVRKEVSNFLKRKYDVGLEDKFVTEKIRKKMKKSSRSSMVGNVVLRWMLASLKKL